ncbi:MAG TPA: DUF1800 domain-containing protein [Candidatus Acidoferrales bacterium]|nr:DUF1800 domain-containing protein [Candidatus Acidoferrales bacterium]
MANPRNPVQKPNVRSRASVHGVAALALMTLWGFTAPYVFGGTDQASKHTSKSAAPTSKVLKGLPITELDETEAILHALNRLGYGPRPGDVEHIREIGLAKWIDEQLNPSSIDDSRTQARLANFPTLKMSSAQLIEQFPRPQVAAKREGISVEEYRKQMQEQRQQAMRQMNAAENGGTSQGDGASGTSKDTDDPVSQQLEEMSGDKSAKLGKQGYNGGDPNKSPMMAYQQLHTPQRIVAELAMAKMDRAVYSDRQLEEQLDDFWFNHFNVFANKGQDAWLLTSYERDAIRPSVLGKFQDLVTATAKSPAMLFYLDNWQSADPAAAQRLAEKRAVMQERAAARRAMYGIPPMGMPGNPNAQQQKQKREMGLNENYGRELMELHTLGVDGGYSQDDVIAVAKCFTGWTIKQPQKEAEFNFNDDLHVRGPKTVLGHTIDAGGMGDGEEVIRLLSRDPHTAHHIASELAQHFVSDNPPQALVDRMARTFLEKDGDLKAVMRAMIYSPEFWSREAYRAKVKTPFELVASAARAVNADIDIPLPMVMWTARIGEPLYQCQPPTGYKDTADTWVNTGALLNRLNYSLTLAGNRLRGSRVDIASLLGVQPGSDPEAALDEAIATLLHSNVAPQTRTTLQKQLTDPQVLQASLDDQVKQVNLGTVAGLVLGAPEFQRR